jgi:type II secretion system protein N
MGRRRQQAMRRTPSMIAMAQPMNWLGAMRIPALMILAASACADHSASVEKTQGEFRLADIVETGTDAVRVHVDRHDVPLHDMELARWLAGLPMDGLADVTVDLTVPSHAGVHDYAKASGSFAFACRTGCTLGDDHSVLGVGGGLPFGHLTFDKIDVRGVVQAGHVEVSRWQLESKDVMLTATLQIELAPELDDSTIAGCVRFKPDPELAHRDPKTAAVIATTGALQGPDGVYSIKLEGTLGKRKLLGKVCT